MDDDIFDETGDDLAVARHDTHLIETIRFNDGFREGLESSEQDAFENGFIRAYGLISTLVYDFYLEKERLRRKDSSHSLLTKEISEFDLELKSIVNLLKRPDETTEEQQVETIKRIRTQFDELQLKIQLALMSIKSP